MDIDDPNHDQSKHIKVRPTYAEVVSSQKTQIECIRNIQISDKSKIGELQTELLKNDKLKALGILTKKPNGQISIRCENVNVAQGVDDFIIEKYANKCKSNMPRPYVPIIKITGLDDTDTDALVLLNEIQKQNTDVVADFKFIREFEINYTRNPYRNIIANCSLAFLKSAVGRQIMLNGRILRCYEQVSTLQCFNCYAFGHISANCKNKITCRNCTGEHTSKNCKATIFKCANCVGRNKDSNHKATSETCPSRIERINGIIDYLKSKN